MSVLNKTTVRRRSVLKTFTSASLATVESNYSTFESDKCDDDTTKTWEVRIIAAYYDGTNHVIIAEANYPEISDDGSTIPVGV